MDTEREACINDSEISLEKSKLIMYISGDLGNQNQTEWNASRKIVCSGRNWCLVAPWKSPQNEE